MTHASRSSRVKIRIGISGWTYEPWRGAFYPEDLPQREELEFAARQFRSIEINGTHYGLQTPKSFQSWRERTPDDFVFSVKGGRYITHLRRLREIRKPLANFFASGVLALEEKLGPFLWQFPPTFQFDAGRFESFLQLLPADTEAAVKLGREHDDHLKDRAWLRPKVQQKLRHAVEIRHKSFLAPQFVELLRKFGIAFVLADTAGKWPYVEELTGDFLYARLHGDKELYASGYSEEALQDWAGRIRGFQAGKLRTEAPRVTNLKPRKPREAFIYFDNDVKVKAPRDAKRLAEILHAT